MVTKTYCTTPYENIICNLCMLADRTKRRTALDTAHILTKAGGGNQIVKGLQPEEKYEKMGQMFWS